MTTKTKWILIGLAFLPILSIFLAKGCNNPSPSGSPIQSVGTVVTVFKDSNTTIKQQELLIVQSQATIESLQDSLEALTEKLTGVKPQFIIRYKDTTKFRDSILFSTKDDSLLIDSLEKSLSQSTEVVDNFIKSNKWISVPRTFVDSGKFFRIKGTIWQSGVDIKDLQVYNSTSVVIGQKSSFFSTGPVVVNVAEDNPMLSSGQLQSFQYVSKTRKWSLVAGPAVIFNGKQFYQGIGLCAGYKIF